MRIVILNLLLIFCENEQFTADTHYTVEPYKKHKKYFVVKYFNPWPRPWLLVKLIHDNELICDFIEYEKVFAGNLVFRYTYLNPPYLVFILQGISY